MKTVGTYPEGICITDKLFQSNRGTLGTFRGRDYRSAGIAFGQNEHPDFEAFLESRCFPRSRDKMKLILNDLNLPFYDPFMIIEKTEGRMAEDHFGIKIERKTPKIK